MPNYIIIFLKDGHYRVLVYIKKNIEICYFDSLADK